MPLPNPFGKLIGLARSQLPTISRLWEAVGGNTIKLLNEIRSLFNLGSQREAADIYKEALDYSKTSAGQATLGSGLQFDPGDIPLNVGLRSPFGSYGRYTYVVQFRIGDEWRSFREWNDFVPSQASLEHSAAEQLFEWMDISEEARDLVEKYGYKPSQIVVANPQKRY